MNITKTTKKDGEYRVRLFIDDVYQAGADYFTTDKQDAKDTAAQMVLNGGISDKTTEFAIAEQIDFDKEKEEAVGKQEFTTYEEWKAAVEKAGLEIDAYVDVENAPSPDDAYQPAIAINEEGAILGHFTCDRNEAACYGGGHGILFDVYEDYFDYCYEGDEFAELFTLSATGKEIPVLSFNPLGNEK